jgi:homoserine kinase
MGDYMVRIKIPATSANIGPGYDCLGLALDLFNEITIEKQDNKIEVLWECENPGISLEDNLFYTSLLKTLNKYGKGDLGGKLTIKEINIPVSRGLGSSASAIVGGIYAANYLMDDIMSTEDVLDLATEMEGHPDNVAPAILGNMVLSTMHNEQVLYSVIDFPKDLAFKVMTPDFKLSTEKSRSVLPETYKIKDIVSNSSHLALMIEFLRKKEYNKLRICLEDRLHQPYRFPLINNSLDIFDKSKELGAIGEFISGAGPTLIALVEKDNMEYDLAMGLFLSTLKDNWVINDFNINNTGTIIERLK